MTNDLLHNYNLLKEMEVRGASGTERGAQQALRSAYEPHQSRQRSGDARPRVAGGVAIPGSDTREIGVRPLAAKRPSPEVSAELPLGTVRALLAPFLLGTCQPLLSRPSAPDSAAGAPCSGGDDDVPLG